MEKDLEKASMTTEDRRLQRIKQLKAKIEKEEARYNENQRKKRNGQLIAFGIYLEEFFKTADEDGRTRLEESIRKNLSGRNLERAIEGLKRLKG